MVLYIVAIIIIFMKIFSVIIFKCDPVYQIPNDHNDDS